MPDTRLAAWRVQVDTALSDSIGQSSGAPGVLREAMRHAVLLGGKRMRPLLVMASAAIAGAHDAAALPAAVAVELVHAYSLVHDDLPAMDDDTLRRGQPTVHVAFDEATAILAGDALQALAFEVLARSPLPASSVVSLVATLAQAGGAAGMCGGQSLDLLATGHSSQTDLAALERLHALKTGALIRAAVRMGALCGEPSPAALDALDRFAVALGLAFQVRDDILDVESDSTELGKTAGKDAAQDKATFPALLGLPASRARLDTLQAEMHEALLGFGDAAGPLRELGTFAVQRRH